MGLFDWLRGGKPPVPRVPLAPPQEYLALMESTRVTYAAITVGETDELDPRASKLGGVPYRPIAGAHDALLSRDELSSVAQVRCSELPGLPAFPRGGVMQFWIVRRDLFDGVGELDLERYEAAGHRVGGYCAFTQSDPRSPDDPMVSLLQLDSEQGVQWGDAGIAHWFLREADLRARSFERTLFYWDCC